ncbi:MAG: succinyl-CoA synthetase subunit beta, partial [Proteobacteria bacterium]|nr:succinyl-CoA synthetase subunit beta [Pseudomonadota bacterium]
MKVHEYQAKEILRNRGVPVPRGESCFSVEDAVRIADD